MIITYQHFEGYYQDRQNLLKITNKKELLILLDSLYGRKELDESSPLEELMAECLRQQERDWRIEPTFGTF